MKNIGCLIRFFLKRHDPFGIVRREELKRFLLLIIIKLSIYGNLPYIVTFLPPDKPKRFGKKNKSIFHRATFSSLPTSPKG
jgi:hypothetical protein